MHACVHACVRACVRAYVQRRMLDLGLSPLRWAQLLLSSRSHLYRPRGIRDIRVGYRFAALALSHIAPTTRRDATREIEGRERTTTMRGMRRDGRKRYSNRQSRLFLSLFLFRFFPFLSFLFIFLLSFWPGLSSLIPNRIVTYEITSSFLRQVLSKEVSWGTQSSKPRQQGPKNKSEEVTAEDKMTTKQIYRSTKYDALNRTDRSSGSVGRNGSRIK